MFKEGISFDDVLIKPEYTEIESRSHVNTAVSVGGLSLKVPLISSPMDTVTEVEMAVELGRLGGLGILHRFSPAEHRLEMIKGVHSSGVYTAYAVGASNEEIEFMRLVESEFGHDKVDLVCIDMANGWSVIMKRMILHIKESYPSLKIMAGNVASGGGYNFLADLGVDAVRVGIGGGSICMTRIQTGIGVPTLQSILDCNYQRQLRISSNLSAPDIVADGGVKYPQDLCKSMIAGASAVMAGGIFAGTKEAPGEIVRVSENDLRKRYRGAASAEVQEEKRGGLKSGTVAEGVSTLIPYEGSLSRVVTEFSGGLRSSMSYVNSLDTQSYIGTPYRLITITENGVKESHAYGTRRR